MTTVNKHGLSRTVPRGLQEELRQRCGFGCVICGTCFYDYEHFDPDFVDAVAHLPEGMTLLCMQCNQKRKRGLLSRQTVALHNAGPKCLQQGFAREWLDYGTHPVSVAIGSCSSTWGEVITVDNESILAVRPPPEIGMPWNLSAKFADDQGRPTLAIEDNHLVVYTSTWDVRTRGTRIIVRSRKGKHSLVIKMEPPDLIRIEKLDMSWAGREIKVDKLRLRFRRSNNEGWATLQNVHMASEWGMGFIRI